MNNLEKKIKKKKMKKIFKTKKYFEKSKFFAKNLSCKGYKFKNFATKIKFSKPNFKWVYGGAIITTALLIHEAGMDDKSESYLTSISDGYKKLDIGIRKQILKSLIVYPKTASIIEDKPLINKEVEVLSEDAFNRIIKEVQDDVNLQAIGVLQDLEYILRTMALIRQDMLLDKVDMIQIYKGGLDVLRIVIKNNKNGRSAYVEINSVRLSTKDFLQARNGFWSTFINYSGWIITGVAGAIYIIGKAYKGDKKDD